MNNCKLHTSPTLGLRWIILLAAACLTSISAIGQPNEPTNGVAGRRALLMQGMMHTTMMQSNLMERCQAMMAAHEKLQATIKQQDAELDKLVTEMKLARGKKRDDIMADILAKMVQERTTTYQQLAAMHTNMMHLMAAQMQAGAQPGGKQPSVPPAMQLMTNHLNGGMMNGMMMNGGRMRGGMMGARGSEH